MRRNARALKAFLTTIGILPIFLASCVTVTRFEPATPVADIGVRGPHPAFVFSPDGSILAIAPRSFSRDPVLLWDVATWSERAPLEALASMAMVVPSTLTRAPVSFSSDGRLVAVGVLLEDFRTAGIAVYSVATSKRVAFLVMPNHHVLLDASFSETGAILYAEAEIHIFPFRYWTMRVSEWDFSSGATLWTEGPIDVDGPVGFSPNGRLLAYVRRRVDRLDLWDTTLRRHRATVEQTCTTCPIIFSPDEERIAIWGRNLAFVVDTHSGKVAQRVSFQDMGKGNQPSAAFSPDGHLLAFSLPGEGIQLYDVATGERTVAVRESGFPAFTNFNAAMGIVFSPDGRRLFFSTRGTLKVWDVARLTGSTPAD